MSDLNIVTFNIRCFGFDGDYYSRARAESRISYIKEFIVKNYSDTDVFILQEIMDLPLLSSILPDGFKFYTYTHEYNRHMYVVLACRKDFEFTDVKIIPNTALDKTKSRPVLYGTLIKNGVELLHVIGLHLKSGFEHTDKRVFQSDRINEFINTLNSKLPIIMAGDFNSHFKTRTKKEDDDLFYLQEIFNKTLKLQNHNKKTYVLPSEDAHLDHFWTKDLKVKSLQVYELETYSEANSLKNYYREISDHLPVKIKVSF